MREPARPGAPIALPPRRLRRRAACRFAEPVRSLRELEDEGLDREAIVRAYRNVLVTRAVEERGEILYRQGKVPGSYYTGRGNECAAVGVATAMGPDDMATPTQRDMGVHVTRGVEPWRVLAQYMGRAGSPTGGRDGSVHLGDLSLGTIPMVSHLPAMLPVACGLALAFQIRRERRVAVGWMGDGSAARGDAHEAMNFAGVRRLPMVFVIDNNQFAYTTPNRLEFSIDHLAERAAAYGFDGVVVDGTDLPTVWREAHRAIERARAGHGPTLIECETLRLAGHGAHDDARYVPQELRDQWADREPVERLQRWLGEHAGWTAAEERALRADVRTLLDAAVEEALASPLPDPATLLDGVYAA
jgi:pyruvate dehydrogenase E1 component alpha subunit